MAGDRRERAVGADLDDQQVERATPEVIDRRAHRHWQNVVRARADQSVSGAPSTVDVERAAYVLDRNARQRHHGGTPDHGAGGPVVDRAVTRAVELAVPEAHGAAGVGADGRERLELPRGRLHGEGGLAGGGIGKTRRAATEISVAGPSLVPGDLPEVVVVEPSIRRWSWWGRWTRSRS